MPKREHLYEKESAHLPLLVSMLISALGCLVALAYLVALAWALLPTSEILVTCLCWMIIKETCLFDETVQFTRNYGSVDTCYLL